MNVMPCFIILSLYYIGVRIGQPDTKWSIIIGIIIIIIIKKRKFICEHLLQFRCVSVCVYAYELLVLI